MQSTPDFELRESLAAINNRENYREFFKTRLLEAAQCVRKSCAMRASRIFGRAKFAKLTGNFFAITGNLNRKNREFWCPKLPVIFDPYWAPF